MPSLELTSARVFALKSKVRLDYDEIKSSHISEAIACALGFNKHAALKATIAKQKDGDAPYIILNDNKFISKIKEFGYRMQEIEHDFTFNHYEEEGLIQTEPVSSFEIMYTSKRDKAWRNLIVYTVNIALDKKIFTLREDDNRWEGWSKSKDGVKGCLFDFHLPSGLLVQAYVYDAGFGELAIHAAVNPKGDWVKHFNSGFDAGDVFATSWLERKDGAWLQTSTNFKCRKVFLDEIATLDVTPNGYGDKGRIIM